MRYLQCVGKNTNLYKLITNLGKVIDFLSIQENRLKNRNVWQGKLTQQNLKFVLMKIIFKYNDKMRLSEK